MKYIFTICLLAIIFSARSQTPLAEVFHGCGGATVTAYPSDPNWTSVTYLFQRFEGGSWGTVHTTITNWHLVTPGDITGPSNYRAILRNNVTSEERISNGVTVNPALFFNTVPPPNPQVTMHWGGDNTGGVNYAEVLPFPFGANSRPPYTFEYKKTTDVIWQNKMATTGVFLFPLDANAQYQFRVTDICGQTSNIDVAELSSTATAFQSTTNCSGGVLQVGASLNGGNSSVRSPFTFGCSLLPPGTPTNPVPDAILNAIAYSYPAGNISGLANGQYVVRGRDRFGVLTKYQVVTVTVNPPAPPFVVSFGPGSGYCQFNAGIQSNPLLKGIRPAGSTQPYTFSAGLMFSNLQGGQTYEMVLEDTCGNISVPILLNVPAVAPRINSATVSRSNCKYVITVNANVCSTPEYGIQLSGSSTTNWQGSNVFANLPMTEACHTVFVRDINSGLVIQQQVCTEGIQASEISGRDYPDCNSLYNIQISPFTGVPPYSYSISYDGINFSSPVSNPLFSNLQPGTYNIRASDACGLSLQTPVSTIELGSVFYLKESGVNQNCSNGDTAGGYLKFGLRIYNDEPLLSPPPFNISVKEVVSINGNDVQYGNTVYTGQFSDTIITINGLDGNKYYGFFVSNACGQSFTSAGRVVNAFLIPGFVGPDPIVGIDVSNCASPFITATNLPANAMVRIFSGQDTSGIVQAMVNDHTSDVLAGGFYTVKLNTANYNGCYWEKVQTLFVKTDDSTRAGDFDNTISSGFCSGISSPVSLYQNIKNETPGGEWYADPALNWSDQATGEFIPAAQADGIYRITYLVNSDCGVSKFLEFQVSINSDYCRLTQPGDYESALTSTGCKTYAGGTWQQVFDSRGNLVYSINAGNGNTIQSACWGVRALLASGNPRSTVINGNTVYFASRNFYIEPSATTIANPPARVRLYYQYDEVNQLLDYLHSNGFPAATVNDLRILKKRAGTGSPVNLEIVNDPGTPSSLYSVISPVAVPFGPMGAYYFEFEINSFSEFAIVFSNNFSLPLTWLSVNGQIQKGNALIKWATANETNMRSFEIEHSRTGADYLKVGTVRAAANSTSTKRYEFVHSSPAAGINYYRIKQIDLDGRFTYSTVIVLNNNSNEKKILISPNPVPQSTTVYFNESGSKTINLLNANGQLVLSQLIPQGNRSHTINMSHLPAGLYLLQIQIGNKTETHKIIKQ